MPITDIKRPNYYQGQYLGAQDLVAAQEYQRRQDQRRRLAAHTWGIAVGLDLEERPKPGGSPAVDVYLKPGYAVDGFGRTITVLEPYKLPEALFAQFTLDPALPDGRWVPVWLRYREQKTDPPKAGYAVCDCEEQANRVSETFRLVLGELPLASQRDPISVAGKMADAANEKIPDNSVPYQALPDPGDASRWLIRLGSVRWLAANPPATLIGTFVKSETPAELEKAREGRPYIGVVAKSVLAPARSLRIADRFADPLPNDPKDPRFGGVAVALEGSLEVDRLLSAKQDAHVEGRVGLGTINPTGRLSINGLFAPPQGALTVFAADGDFVYDGGDDKLFIFKDTGGRTAFMGGNIGIGTTVPVSKLQVQGDLALEATAQGSARALPAKGTLVWNDGTWLRLNQNLDFSKPIFGVHTPGLFAPGSLNVGGGAGWGDPGPGNAWITGKVGIGTATPQAKLEVVGDVKVTGGKIFVDGHLIPVSVPVDVIVGERALQQLGAGGGIDTFKLQSRLASVSSADVIVALSHIRNINVATDARWKVQKNVVFRDGASPNIFNFHIAFQVDDIDGELLSYSFVAIFIP